MMFIKPTRIGAMPRLIFERPGGRQVVSGILCFDLLQPDTFRTEQDFWPLIQSVIGESDALDHWVPKVRGEVLLWGDAVPPGGKAVREMTLSLQVGEVKKRLRVHGDRVWERSLLGYVASNATPFTSMPLIYERAFGGPELPACPVGIGYRAQQLIDDGKIVRLPNVELAEQPLLHPNDEISSASFKPADLTWPGRLPCGTWSPDWLRRRFPAMPEDFSWEAYCLAPQDQQIPGFFRGDESVRLSGFHAEYPEIVTRLPGVCMRAFVQRQGESGLDEMSMHLDTVALFPGVLSGLLIFRGEVAAERSDASDIERVMLGAEYLNAPRSTAHYEDVFSARTGENSIYFALADYQLMPPISEIVRTELARDRAEVVELDRQKSAKRHEWFEAGVLATLGSSLAQYWPVHLKTPPKTEFPLVTPAEIAQGQANYLGVKQAMDALGEQAMNDLAEAKLLIEKQQAATSELIAESKGIIKEASDVPNLEKISQEQFEKLADTYDAAAIKLKNDPSFRIEDAVSLLIEQNGADLSPLTNTAEMEEAFKEMMSKYPSLKSGEVDGTKGIAEILNSMTEGFHSTLGAQDEMREALITTFGKVAQRIRSGEVLNDANGQLERVRHFETELSSLGEKEDVGVMALGRRMVESTYAQFDNTLPKEAQEALDVVCEKMMASEGLGLGNKAELEQELKSAFKRIDEFDLAPEQKRVFVDFRDDALAQLNAEFPDTFQKSGEINLDALLAGIGSEEGEFLKNASALGVKETEEPSALEMTIRQAESLARGKPMTSRAVPMALSETPSEAELLVKDYFDAAAMQNALEGGDEDALNSYDLWNPPLAVGNTDVENSQLVAKREQLITATMMDPSVLAMVGMRKVLPKLDFAQKRMRLDSPIPVLNRDDVVIGAVPERVGDIVREAAGRGESLAGRDLAGANLRNADLSGLDLQGAFFEYADLTGANLSGANCESAVFAGAILDRACLDRACLKGANFGRARARETTCRGADLSQAELCESDWTRSNLSATRLNECKGREAVFVEAVLDETQAVSGSFYKVDFSGASMQKLNWAHVTLMHCNLPNAIGHQAKFMSCVFVEAQAANCNFSEADFSKSIMSKCNFSHMSADGLKASSASWQESDLSHGSFAFAQMQGANFSKSKLFDVNLAYSDLQDAIFCEANLRDARLDGAQCYRTGFTKADLRGAQLRHTNLHFSDVLHARLENSDLTGARRIQTMFGKPA